MMDFVSVILFHNLTAPVKPTIVFASPIEEADVVCPQVVHYEILNF